MKKDIFVDGHKWLDVVKDCKIFFNKIEKHKPYLVEFNENSKIKDKIYLSNCAVDNKHCRSVIIMTYNEYTFSVNDSICKT